MRNKSGHSGRPRPAAAQLSRSTVAARSERYHRNRGATCDGDPNLKTTGPGSSGIARPPTPDAGQLEQYAVSDSQTTADRFYPQPYAATMYVGNPIDPPLAPPQQSPQIECFPADGAYGPASAFRRPTMMSPQAAGFVHQPSSGAAANIQQQPVLSIPSHRSSQVAPSVFTLPTSAGDQHFTQRYDPNADAGNLHQPPMSTQALQSPYVCGAEPLADGAFGRASAFHLPTALSSTAVNMPYNQRSDAATTGKFVYDHYWVANKPAVNSFAAHAVAANIEPMGRQLPQMGYDHRRSSGAPPTHTNAAEAASRSQCDQHHASFRSSLSFGDVVYASQAARSIVASANDHQAAPQPRQASTASIARAASNEPIGPDVQASAALTGFAALLQQHMEAFREDMRAERAAERAEAAELREEVASLGRQLHQLQVQQSATRPRDAQQVTAAVASASPLPCVQPSASAFNYSQPPAAASSANASYASNAPSGSHFHDPRRSVVDLPPFSGSAEQWPMFIGMFRHTTAAYGYTNLENQGRLVKCLSGEALDAVSCVLIRPDNVEAVLTALERKFGRPDILVRSQLKNVRSLAALDETKLEQLEPFANKVQNLVTFLDSDTTRPYLCDATILEELVHKLPPNRRMEWAGVVHGLARLPTLVDFADWIVMVAHKASLVSVPTVDSTPTPQRQSSKAKHVMLNTVGKASSRPCIFCTQHHRPADCERFQSLSISDRWREVDHNRMCTNCLVPGHSGDTCWSKRTCAIDGCGQPHHALLHSTDDTGEQVERPQESSAKRRNRSRRATGQNDSAHQAAPHATAAITPASTVSGNNPFGPPKTSAAINHSGTGTESNPFDPPQVVAPISPSGPVACRCIPPTPSVQIVREDPGDLVLYRIIPVRLYGPNRTIDTYAMMDDGAAVTVIDSSLAAQLELDGPLQDLTIRWWGQHSANEKAREVSLGISGIEPGHSRHELRKIRAVDNFDLPSQTVHLADLHTRYHHLRQLPIAGYHDAVPKILLGNDYHHLCVPLKLRVRQDLHGLAAVKTKLGWVVYGRDDHHESPAGARIMHCRVEPAARDDDLERIVAEYYTTESFGVKQPAHELESDENANARTILEATTKRIGPRYQTGLLWKPNAKPLPDSYQMALRRLQTVEAKMRRDPAYGAQYDDHIASYIAKGYARKLLPNETSETNNRTWYLPHFGVKNPNKPGKFRLVFDAAATVNGVSLNSVLLKGPDLNQPLPRILFKFRMGVIGICADIREMFHQVLIQPSDQNAQRFLWRHGNRDNPPDVYVMQVMTFGATCSPASAQFVKNTNATEFETEHPAAAHAIKTMHYVDDYVASFQSVEEAADVTANVVRIHHQGGFELRGFVSNSSPTLAALGANVEHGQPVPLQPDNDASSNKILGMCWRTAEDAFSFEVGFHRVPQSVMSGERTPTKREMLSAAMSVFDPYGLVADFMLPAKLLVQDLWKVGSGWDDPVPEDINRRWLAWRDEVDKLRTLRIPRCYSAHIKDSPNVQLHIFADASEAAFAAVAYWRIDYGGQIEVAFVIGKTRCAPLKILSIPRLELQAAVLATRLLLTVKDAHEIEISRVVMWTDSRTVEQWIHSDQRRFKPFVAHRVAEVLDGAGSSCWRWLPSAENVADDGTRVKFPPRFDPESRWLRGPAFLQLEENEWPQRTTPTMAEEEIGDTEEIRARFVGVTMVQSKILNFSTFDELHTLCRTVAWAIRFMRNTSAKRSGSNESTGELCVSEVDDATLRIIQIVQTEGFPEESDALVRGVAIDRRSPIFRLFPYLDAVQKVIRLTGRTDAADARYLSLDAQRPIILPRHHQFTKLVARHHHQLMGHQNEDATIASIRQRYWVPQLRRLVRSVKNECPLCRIRTAIPRPIIMGQLPADRLTPYVRPFTFTGLDFFGPLIVTVGRRNEKRWVALFTCLTIRAVHLEIAADLSADACLLCVRNFANIRGVPQRIRSDNGTNFVGAWGEIQREKTFFDENVMRRGLTQMGIDWLFNCPGNPEAGGAWERLVQSTKRVLAVTLKEVAPRVETLRGLLLEAANIINSRPLTHVPVEPSDLEPLTPNHFLLGGPNSTTTPRPDDGKQICTRKQWRICQQLTHRFWHRWVQDYLPELTRRSKHYAEVAPLKVDDLVLVCDANMSRNQWRRGRVVRTIVGADGRVRTAEVRTSDGCIRRPVTKLALLDVSMTTT